MSTLEEALAAGVLRSLPDEALAAELARRRSLFAIDLKKWLTERQAVLRLRIEGGLVECRIFQQPASFQADAASVDLEEAIRTAQHLYDAERERVARYAR